MIARDDRQSFRRAVLIDDFFEQGVGVGEVARVAYRYLLVVQRLRQAGWCARRVEHNGRVATFSCG